MALQDDLNRLQKQLGNFLFPRKCPFCGTQQSKDAVIMFLQFI